MTLAVLDVPSNLGLRPGTGGAISGVDRLAATVRAGGLMQRLQDATAGPVLDAGAISVPPYDLAGWKPGDPPFNAQAIHDLTIDLADRIEQVDCDKLLLLGGDCSILLGPLLALNRRGTPGLVFIDAHSDFRHENLDAAAGEELAITTGRGGHFLTDLEGRGPLVADDQVVLIGVREADDDVPFPLVTTAADALASITATDIWVHVDADVLDPSYLPAVDSPEPGGLSPDELVELLRPLLAHPKVRGMDLCIYDPALDAADAPGAAVLVDLLGRVFDRRTSQ